MEPTMFFVLFAHPAYMEFSMVDAESVKPLMLHFKASNLNISVGSMIWVFSVSNFHYELD